MAQNYDNDILEGLTVADPLTLNPLFLNWRGWQLPIPLNPKSIVS
jgi:hypothetical protein